MDGGQAGTRLLGVKLTRNAQLAGREPAKVGRKSGYEKLNGLIMSRSRADRMLLRPSLAIATLPCSCSKTFSHKDRS
jgi:hypothetical protein